jgi:hypothetical protein
MKLLRIGSVALFGLATAACGGGEEVVLNEQAADGVAQQTISASKSVVATNDGETAAGTFGALGNSMGALFTPAGARSGPQSAGHLGQARQADSTGSADCDAEAKSCTFSGSTSSGGIAGSIEGSFSWGNGHIKGDLGVDLDIAGSSMSIQENIDLTITDSSIDGSFSFEGSLEAEQASAEFSGSLVFDNVTFNAVGCPTGGSMQAEYDASGDGASVSGSGTVTFDGSRCQ